MIKFGWLAAVAGCVLERPDPGNGGQIGEEGTAGCEVVERIPLGRDEVSPLGFSPAQILAFAIGGVDTELVYASGEVTPVSVTVDDTGVLEFLRQELVVTGDGPVIEIDCPDQVSIGVAVTFTTDDGVFAEAWDGALLAGSADQAWLTRDLDGAAGTFDASDHVPAGSDFDEVRAWLDLIAAPSGLSGIVSGQGSGVIGDPNDPDSVAYAEGFDIANFGTDDAE